MLIIKVLTTKEEIDEICILNTGKKAEDGRSIYKIVKPEIPDVIIAHNRDDGYENLLLSVLKIIIHFKSTLNDRKKTDQIIKFEKLTHFEESLFKKRKSDEKKTKPN